MRFFLFNFIGLFCSVAFFTSCKKAASNQSNEVVNNTPFLLAGSSINGESFSKDLISYDVNTTPNIVLRFNKKINRTIAANAIVLLKNGNESVKLNYSFLQNDSAVSIVAQASLAYLTKYILSIDNSLQSESKQTLSIPVSMGFITTMDSTDKFPVLTEAALLDTAQKATFNYFWNFGHPISGMARERNTSGDIVTSGGTGFGIMALVVAVERNFISRSEGLARMKTIVSFLQNKAKRFHGAFPHWLNGITGDVVPFSIKDNGADLVETSFLIAGLLSARMYFSGLNTEESTLRNNINLIWDAVDWNWFRQNNQQTLYWHWSPDYQWDLNLKISGWNECLITYVLAASSNTNAIPRETYLNGFARNGSMKNNAVYYNYKLPLGPELGGPLFLSQYSFLGIDPRGLSDPFADYQEQVVNHSLINYNYCINNPKMYWGYSQNCWGLSASDIPNGYSASSPTNDLGVIAPTAALSAFPFTPKESMQALKFFYYKLGDKLWTEYGFVDAFKLQDLWFSTSTLAIDQGPSIIMIENYRSGLIWKLFTACPEIKNGLKKLGFTAPYL
ncbi:glucoamylase family protein [Sediminibacterium sp. C3]|uniref:glucoamylase family protein n=1 Tax=Sediminibacterium sp. C3 TaxID=1267211 RepID=UPI000418775E|nr:glucoamylase family protein [Sediminibacterium sp. C3]